MIVVLDVMSMNAAARKTNLPISPFRYGRAVEECFTFFVVAFFPRCRGMGMFYVHPRL